LMGYNWCYWSSYSDSDTSPWGIVLNRAWSYQRYWQYSYQFIDYNSNADWDSWDEDWDWNIVWDDDDEYLWKWPIVFNWWSDVKELYLISWDKTKRTLFRRNIETDPDKISTAVCNISWWLTTSWDWCRWTVEFLQLDWKDWWLDHDSSSNDSDWTQYDWVIDTWVINEKFTWWAVVIAWSNSTNYREPLFSENINVTDFDIYLYPNVDYSRSWRDSDLSSTISPYVIMNFKIKPSWKTRAVLQWDSDELTFSTTINLTDIYSN
jgi:hypothetical protein